VAAHHTGRVMQSADIVGSNPTSSGFETQLAHQNKT